MKTLSSPLTEGRSAPRTSTVARVATPTRPPTSKLAKRSKVEIIKENSDFLRHPLMQELVDEKTYISEDAVQLMKFHGSYQQDHREKRAFGQGKFYQFMMRTRQPGGVVSNQLYLAMDDLADQFGNGTLRLTTRQAYQLHGVLKQDLKSVFSTVVKNMGSTLGACGDVNRNVMSPPAPFEDKPEYAIASKCAEDIADLLAPQSGAYYDVWLDGEKFATSVRENPKVTEDRKFNGFGTNYTNSAEPIYGTQFLPRKFKIAVTVPGDNSVDIFTNDIGVVVVMDDNGEHVGYNLLVGGGLGRTHRNASTFARMSEPIGYVDKDDIFHAVKAIVAVQRDYGRRDDRKQARLKYLVSEWGIDKFRSVTEQYMGKSFEEFRPLPAWEFYDYLGWGRQSEANDTYFYGCFIQNGRLKGDMKSTLRKVIEEYNLSVRLTPNQNILLCDIKPEWRQTIEAELSAAGVVPPSELDSLDRNSMACPALPLCGLAITEAERGLPDINRRVRALLDKVGLPGETIVMRMTGCANGCARPYMAELGFVGDGPNSYQLWLGGNPGQTAMAQEYKMKVKVRDLENELEPLFVFWRNRRREGEGFGYFVSRVGMDACKQFAESFVSDSSANQSVPIKDDVFEKVAAQAAAEGKSVPHMLNELLGKAMA